MARAKTVPHVHYHKDGTVWAKGQMRDGEMHGYWEWFRKDGVIMRSGHFEGGAQTGEWTTYDKAGRVHKVTQMKAAAMKAAVKAPVVKKAAAKEKADDADAFMAALDHPLKDDIAFVRKTILSVDPSIADGVKWNSLSFRTSEWFATVHRPETKQVLLVLHLGAKGKAAKRLDVPDPKGLLEWKSNERALARLGSGAALKANAPALKAIVKTWIKAV